MQFRMHILSKDVSDTSACHWYKMTRFLYSSVLNEVLCLLAFNSCVWDNIM